jgi:Arc/MetJ-type ribon-helix-helix transcriptional regulator
MLISELEAVVLRLREDRGFGEVTVQESAHPPGPAGGGRARLGMIEGMTKSKIAVTLPPALVARARRAVRAGRAASVSAYIAAALEEKSKLDDLADMLAEMLAETGGPLTERERRAADEALGVRRRRRRGAA